MLGSVDGFLPRPRMAVGLAQNLNFGLRGISSLLVSAPHHSTTAVITSKSVCCLKLGQFRKGSSSSNSNGGGLCANCGSKTQSLKPKGCGGNGGGGKGVNETEREREKEVIKELRRELRRERKQRRVAMEELEREREASAWASEEAMAKIMLLQSEKASAEQEARQYREAAEQRELHDKEVIEYLQLLLRTISVEKNGGGEMESSGVL